MRNTLLRTIAREIWQDRWARAGAAFLLFALTVTILAPWISPYHPRTSHTRADGVLFEFQDGQWSDPERVGDRTLTAAAVTGAGSGWAVGMAGAVARFADGEQEVVDSPTDADLHGVAAADGVVVAVGSAGTILTFDGSDWRSDSVGDDVELRAVAMGGPDSALAVGAGGAAFHWDGDRWEPLASGVDRDLYGVALEGEDFGLAVGDRGTILTFDGTSLKEVVGVSFRDLRAVDVVDRTHAVVVGARGTILEHRDGAWSTLFSRNSRDLFALRLDDAEQGWAVGDRVILRLADGEWTEDTNPGRSLLGLDSTDGYAVAVGAPPALAVLSPPSPTNLLGTTQMGQDVLSQTIYGSRIALVVGFVAALMIVFIGANVGLIAGYFKGKTGDLLMRLVDVTYGIPFEPFALVLVVVFQPSILIIVLAIALLAWRTTARIVRSQVLSLSARPFVKAARVAGAGDWRILYVHIAPNVLPLIFLQLAVATSFAIVAEATLSFLGLGSPEAFSWGSILYEARISGGWRTAWWWVVPPGLAIMLTVVSVFFISRALETLANPRLRVGD